MTLTVDQIDSKSIVPMLLNKKRLSKALSLLLNEIFNNSNVYINSRLRTQIKSIKAIIMIICGTEKVIK